MTKDAYKDALEKAESDLRNASRHRDYWTLEVAKLEQLVKSLAAMSASSVKEQIPDRDEIGIQEIIFTCIRLSSKPLSPTDIRDALKDLNYDLTRYNNPLAVIHSAIKRLVDGRFIEDATGDGRYSVDPVRMGLTKEQRESIIQRAGQVLQPPTRRRMAPPSSMAPRVRGRMTPPPSLRDKENK